jgi:hypothetical protein
MWQTIARRRMLATLICDSLLARSLAAGQTPDAGTTTSTAFKREGYFPNG